MTAVEQGTSNGDGSSIARTVADDAYGPRRPECDPSVPRSAAYGDLCSALGMLINAATLDVAVDPKARDHLLANAGVHLQNALLYLEVARRLEGKS